MQSDFVSLDEIRCDRTLCSDCSSVTLLLMVESLPQIILSSNYCPFRHTWLKTEMVNVINQSVLIGVWRSSNRLFLGNNPIAERKHDGWTLKSDGHNPFKFVIIFIVAIRLHCPLAVCHLPVTLIFQWDPSSKFQIWEPFCEPTWMYAYVRQWIQRKTLSQFQTWKIQRSATCLRIWPRTNRNEGTYFM